MKPEHPHAGSQMYAAILRVMAEQKALVEVRSPVGLARLFPGLKRA